MGVSDGDRLYERGGLHNQGSRRFVRSIKEECLTRMIFFGQASLRHAIAQYMTHYHGERDHHGVGNRLLQPPSTIGGELDGADQAARATRRHAQLLSSRSCLADRPPTLFLDITRERVRAKIPLKAGELRSLTHFPPFLRVMQQRDASADRLRGC